MKSDIKDVKISLESEIKDIKVRLESEIRLMKWMLGALLGGVVAILVRLFIK